MSVAKSKLAQVTVPGLQTFTQSCDFTKHFPNLRQINIL